MIVTTFENLTDINAELVTVNMPYPVQSGEYVEFNDVTWVVLSTYWIIKTDPETMTRAVKLHVRIK